MTSLLNYRVYESKGIRLSACHLSISANISTDEGWSCQVWYVTLQQIVLCGVIPYYRPTAIYIRVDGFLCTLPPLYSTIFLPFFVSNYSCINPITGTISHVIGQSAQRSGSLSGFLTNIKTNWKQYWFMSPWERAPYQRPALHPLPGLSVSVCCSLFLSSQLSPSSWFPLFISLSPY